MTEATDILTAADEAVIAEELALHEKVKQAVRAEALADSPDMGVIKKQLIELRDEAISASERDLPALFQALYTHHSLASRTFAKKLPDMRAPYFAHLRLLEGGKSREVLIGYQTFIDTKSGVTIIDWRHAALAKVFFNYRQGDDYELELPGRIATGTLTMRRVITFEIGELIGVSGADFALTRSKAAAQLRWHRHEGDGVPQLRGGAGTAVNVNQFGGGGRKLPDVSALLDQEQYEILSRDDQGALLILGGAGSGKTTVALHRMAQLTYQRPNFYQPNAMKVVVPEQGLVRLTERLLSGLGLDGVGVSTYDHWVTEEGRHILKGLPKRTYDWTPSQVVYMKRHPAAVAVVDQYVEMLTQRVGAKLLFVLKGWQDELGAEFLAERDLPLIPRLDLWQERCSKLLADASLQTGNPHAWRKDTLAQFFKEARTELLDIDNARSEIFSNTQLLKLFADASGGQITEKMCGQLLKHTRRQFEDPTGGLGDDTEMRGELAVDGAELEVDDYAGTMDTEDFSLLLLLMLRLHGRVARKTKALTTFKHLVIDEAQDLAPLEHRLLGECLADDATVTIAGDAVQQSDATVVFRGWDDVLTQLQMLGAEEARLNTNYRCPRPVAEFGHKILGPMAPESLPRSIKDGKDVVFSHYPNEGLAIVAITEALNELFEREHLAAVAIICENEENARQFYQGLQNLADVRLVVDGEFSFKPGVDVTDVSQIKGLEFDYVIIPDANANVYPDTPVARRAMHIAVTRAVHQLWVCSVGRASEILA